MSSDELIVEEIIEYIDRSSKVNWGGVSPGRCVIRTASLADQLYLEAVFGCEALWSSSSSSSLDLSTSISASAVRRFLFMLDMAPPQQFAMTAMKTQEKKMEEGPCLT
jgi:hypothetical protein